MCFTPALSARLISLKIDSSSSFQKQISDPINISNLLKDLVLIFSNLLFVVDSFA
jgi:hypothetical protein